MRALPAILLTAFAVSAQAAAQRADERVRVAVVARQPADWAAAGIARATLAKLSQMARVYPVNAAMAQRHVPTAAKVLCCQFIVIIETPANGEAVAELATVVADRRERVSARGPLHQLPGALALALAEAMHLAPNDVERSDLAKPVAASEAAVEALWRGDDAGKPEQQIRLYEAALKSDPDSPIVRNQLGAALAKVGERAKALEQFAEAIRRDPAYAAAHTNRGLVLAQERRWAEAEDALRAAIRLGAKSPTPRIALARLLDRLGNTIEAVDELEAAVDADPCHADALMTLADFYFESYNLRAARQVAERVRALQPDDPAPLNLIGLLLLVPHEYEQAEVAFLKALTLKPGDPGTLANLGLALYGQRQVDMAIGVIKRALAIDPNCTTAHLYLGRIYLAEDKPADAALALQRASELRPALGPAQRGLDSARAAAAAAAQGGGCGCLGLGKRPSLATLRSSSLRSTSASAETVGMSLPAVVLLAPHLVRLSRRRRK